MYQEKSHTLLKSKTMNTKKLLFALFCFQAFFACDTTKDTKKSTVIVADSLANQIKKDSLPNLEEILEKQGLVNIQEVDSSIRVELKYSTTDNFFEKDVYEDLTKAYLQPDVAEQLKEASKELQKQYPTYRLLVYDGVRPYRIQKVLWESLPAIPPKQREAFVANPEKGSIHNYGCAVDLTIFDTATDSTLDMGTKYDYFGDLAYPRKEPEMLRKKLLTQQQIDNRLVLRNAMKNADFMPITSEWWHFNATTLKQAERQYYIIK